MSTTLLTVTTGSQSNKVKKQLMLTQYRTRYHSIQPPKNRLRISRFNSSCSVAKGFIKKSSAPLDKNVSAMPLADNPQMRDLLDPSGSHGLYCLGAQKLPFDRRHVVIHKNQIKVLSHSSPSAICCLFSYHGSLGECWVTWIAYPLGVLVLGTCTMYWLGKRNKLILDLVRFLFPFSTSAVPSRP